MAERKPPTDDEIMRAMNNVLIDSRYAALTAAIKVVETADEVSEAIRMLEDLRDMTTMKGN